MSKFIDTNEELIKTIKEIGNRELFLAQDDLLGCYFIINKDYTKDEKSKHLIQCYMRDLHDELRNITTFVFAIKLDEKVYIAFVDFKNKNSVQMIKKIISQDKIKLRIVNEYENYVLYFDNPSIKDFSQLFDEVSNAVKKENYSKEDFDSLTIALCDIYTNEELWKIWKEEIENE